MRELDGSLHRPDAGDQRLDAELFEVRAVFMFGGHNHQRCNASAEWKKELLVDRHHPQSAGYATRFTRAAVLFVKCSFSET